MKSYFENTEIRNILSFKGKNLPDNQVTGTMSMEMNRSFIKPPEAPWQPRHYDARVSYFSVGQTDYSSDDQLAHRNSFLQVGVWSLRAFRELVEPVKEIIYDLDSGTLHEWILF